MMCWRLGIGVAACLLACATSACSSGSDSDGGGGDGGASGTGGSTAMGGSGGGAQTSPLPTQTGNELVDRLGAAAAQCGMQSSSTVPAGWEMSAWGQGCAIWGPESWAVDGAGTQMIFVSDPNTDVGVVVGGGVPSTGTGPATCTPRGVADYFLALYEELGCTNPTIIHYSEGELVVVTDRYPVGHSVFACDYQGTQMVGYQFTMGFEGALCEVVLSAFWEPASLVEDMTCTLSQVLNSVTCPTGGGESCEDIDCNTACRNLGHEGGRCPENGSDGCECW